MTKTLDRTLPPDALAAFAPHLPAVADEIIAAIAREVPAYARPMEGAFGQAVRLGVEQGLEQFVMGTGSPTGDRGRGRNVYRALGRGEAREGRSLEALLAAYRVGARVAWRRMAAAGLEAGMAPERLVTLADAIFTYIDQLSADSAEGYSREQARRGGGGETRPAGAPGAACGRAAP